MTTKVRTASSMSWWLMAGVMANFKERAGQAAPENQAAAAGVEAAVALEEQGVHHQMVVRAVTAARVLYQPYLVPPTIMAAAEGGVVAVLLEMQDWVEAKDQPMMRLQLQPTQGVGVGAAE